MRSIRAAAVHAGILATQPALAQTEIGPKASALLNAADGQEVATVTLTQGPAGVLLRVEVKNLPPGEHGFHMHEMGECEPPFESAGDHFNPIASEHGFYTIGGPHAGDMPNIHVPESGAMTVEVLNANISLDEGAPEAVFDDDGTSIVVHANADDYQSQPSGEAGDRIACGIVEKQG